MVRISMWVACWLVAVVATAGTAQAQVDASPPFNAITDAQPYERAQPQDTSARLAFVSVESSLPWLTGNDLRRAIRNQSGFEVISPAEGSAPGTGTPAVNAPVMVITISHRAEVTVFCGAAPEGVQWIRVKAPMRSVLDAAATLATAVLSAARDHQEKLAELQRRTLERAVLMPAAAQDVPGNPYYQPGPAGDPLPYLLPYNPYYVSRRRSGSS